MTETRETWQTETVTPTPEQLRRILESAVQAPSADNRHQFLLEPNGDLLRVWCKKGEVAKVAGYKRTLVFLSLGAVAENILVSAAAHGIRGELTFFPSGAEPDLIFEVQWEEADGKSDSLADSIPARHTNRRLFFRGPGLLEDALKALSAEASHYGCDLIWLDKPRTRRETLHLMRLAETERFRNRLLHEDLFNAIRFEVGWTATCEEGLPPGALEVEPILRGSFSLMRHWPVMQSLKVLGTHLLLGVRAAYFPSRWSPHLGLITARHSGNAGLLAAGQAFERVWLRLTARGMALQPMPAAALYALPGATEHGIPVRLQSSLAAGWERICPGHIPLMLFRTGFAPPPAVRASRPNLERFLSRPISATPS